jgi:hypothetical protein
MKPCKDYLRGKIVNVQDKTGEIIKPKALILEQGFPTSELQNLSVL